MDSVIFMLYAVANTVVLFVFVIVEAKTVTDQCPYLLDLHVATASVFGSRCGDV